MPEDADALEAEADAEAGGHPDPDKAGGSRQSQAVPYERFAAVVAKLNDTTERLNATLDGRVKEQNAPKRFTPAELRAAVEAGKLSQDDADTIRDRQVVAETAEVVNTSLAQRQREEATRAEISQYEGKIPQLVDQNSDEYRRVAAEYRYVLQQPGVTAGPGAMLIAVRNVFGPVSALKPGASAKTKDAETFTDGGSGGGDGEGAGGGGGKKPTLNARQRAHYGRLIQQGVYKDWDAVHAEVGFKPGAKK